MKHGSRILQGALLAGLVAAAFGAGYAFRGRAPAAGGSGTERQSNGFARLTSPFLECVGEMNSDRGLVRVRSNVVRYIRAAEARDTSLRVAVYVRDLNNGPWVGINEGNAIYTPASLWKIPLMMYILAGAERDPGMLDEQIVFPGPDRMRRKDSMLGAPEAHRLQTGVGYSYHDLLYRMIAYSDNWAEELLTTGVSKADVDRLLEVINASDTYTNGSYFVNARTYGSLFRVLYNATLLGRPMSEYALSLLTQSYLRQGLRRHIPEGVEVASKFGLRDDSGGAVPAVEFHECGIVYRPGSPYVLCVMTKSAQASPDRLAEIVADISRIVWEGPAPQS